MREMVWCGMAERDTANSRTVQVKGSEVGRSVAAGREERTLVVLYSSS